MQTQADRHVFTQPLPRAAGKTASEDAHARYMLELANLHRDLIALVLVSVFTRKAWAVTIKDKSAASVLSAGNALISCLNERAKVVSTDHGLEYAQFSDYLKEKGIGNKQSVADQERKQ